MMRALKVLLLSTLLGLSTQVQAAAISISTPQVSSGQLIRAADWNRIKADLESLAVGLDIITNQTWLPNGSDIYFNLGKVGLGTATPQAALHVFQQSPLPGTGLLQIGTGTAANRFLVDAEGDVALDGNLLVRGGTLYDSDGDLSVNAEQNLYLSTDWNNNSSDDNAIIFGKNNAGAGSNFVELMRLSEQGGLGLGTATPFQTWSTRPPAGVEASGSGARLALSQPGGDRWAWQLGNTSLDLVNDATTVTPISVNSAGLVGIAQAAPQRDLHVGGFGRFDMGMESNLWCNQSGSGCISQLLVQSLLASGSGPQNCPSGFTMVGGVGQSNTYCIETNERVPTDFWNAKAICQGLSDSTLGSAQLCSPQQWHRACSTSSGNALTGNAEWTNQFDATPQALAMGSTNCQSVSRVDISASQAFRCCY